MQLKVGLIGYGYAARLFHAPFISTVPGMELAMVVERHSDRSKLRYPGVRVVRDVQDLYADRSIDLAVVTAPNAEHYRIARDTLLAGKHVVVEKPFTVTSAEADELIALAAKQGLTLSVYQNRRWDGDFLTAREIVRQDLLGRLTHATLSWDRYAPRCDDTWRNSGEPGAGITYDLGVHLLDQALCLFGAPETITAHCSIQREGAAVDDCFEALLLYPGGFKANLRASMLTRQPTPRFALYGTEGSFVKFGDDPQERALQAGRTPDEEDWGMEPEASWGTLDTSLNGLHFKGRIETIRGNYCGYYRNIAEHLGGRAELEVKPEEARIAIRLIELAMQSSREGRTLDTELYL